MPGHRAEYLAAGMTAYLTKPIVSADLFEVLASVAASRAAGRTWGESDLPPRAPAAPVSPAVPPPAPSEEEFWSTAPLLDDGQALSLLAVIGEEAWEQTVIAFRRTVRDSVGAIRAAGGREGGGVPLVRIAHTLKGTAANIGAVRLSRLASLLEQQALTQGGWPTGNPHCEALEHVAEATLDVLASRIQPLDGAAMEQETA